MNGNVDNNLTLFTIASRQVWPQILAVLRLKPERIFLFHSEDTDESEKPAIRLKKFFYDANLIPRGNITLCSIPHNDFGEVEKAFDSVLNNHNIPSGSIVLNFTGGNKLMATAAFKWATKYYIRSFYLEKGNIIFWFYPGENEIKTASEKLDTSEADKLNPIDVLRCQLSSSIVEQDGEGQLISLSEQGQNESDEGFLRIIKNGNYRPEWLKIEGGLNNETRSGDHLEFRTAAVILKLGIYQVRRSVSLKPKPEEGIRVTMPHTEIDLLFVWNGRLWVVDCKNTISENDICNKFYKQIRNMSGRARILWDRIVDIVRRSHFKILKDDIVTAREVGGLLGSIICVRKSKLNSEINQYARRNGIYIVRANNLYEGLAEILKK